MLEGIEPDLLAGYSPQWLDGGDHSLLISLLPRLLPSILQPTDIPLQIAYEYLRGHIVQVMAGGNSVRSHLPRESGHHPHLLSKADWIWGWIARHPLIQERYRQSFDGHAQP